jgi:D-inositol-3-phosphate glycosyltransferase
VSATPVALVTPALALGGGQATMTAFLYRALAASGRYRPEVISIATSATDTASQRLARPDTWLGEPRVERGEWNGIPFQHVGAWATELEPCRFRPRRVLTDMVRSFPIVQVVAGTAPYAMAIRDVPGHACLWVATSVRGDRESQLRAAPLWRRVWWGAMRASAEAAERAVLASTMPVFALSRYACGALSRIGGGRDVRLVPCGVDTNRFHPRPHGDSGYLLSVGRLSDPRKNVALLVAAYAQVVARRPAVPPLWLVGEPPVAAVRQQIAAHGLDSRIRVLGVRRSDELADLFAGARLFLLSSDEEGLCIALIEAMASGLPAVSTRCGGPEDLIVDGETGRLVAVGDSAALAAAIDSVLSSPEFLTRAGAAARARAERQFSIDVCAAPFLEHYDAILQRT